MLARECHLLSPVRILGRLESELLKIDCMDRCMVQSELLMRRYQYVPPHEEEGLTESHRMAWH